MDDLLNQSAVDLAALLESRSVSAAQVMQATLAQIDATNGAVNAVVSLADPDDLMAQARAADAGPYRGPLHGMPIAVKDLANVKGMPTSMGSPASKDFIAAEDDLVIARMRAAGAIFIGKTNTPEFGLGSHTFNPVHGATHNPYGHGKSAGGSSGGAAAALAARMVPLADGSDMMGSLRNPAGWNNVYGFRPTWGVVPNDPIGDVFMHSLATLGPMARSPRDMALLLDVQAGRDERVPFSLEAQNYSLGLEGDLSGKRIGWLGDWGGSYAMEAGILPLCEVALRQMEDMGARVEVVKPPMPSEEIWQSWVGLRAFANAGRLAPLYGVPEKRKLLKEDAIWEIETGLALSAAEILRLSGLRSKWYQAAVKMLSQYDVLVLPSAQVWPFPVEWTSPAEINGQAMDSYHRWMEVVVPVSLLGLPCINLPVGFGDAGLPMGIQVFAGRGADKAMLQFGQAWHEATNWPYARPPILS